MRDSSKHLLIDKKINTIYTKKSYLNRDLNTFLLEAMEHFTILLLTLIVYLCLSTYHLSVPPGYQISSWRQYLVGCRDLLTLGYLCWGSLPKHLVSQFPVINITLYCHCILSICSTMYYRVPTEIQNHKSIIVP